MICSCTGSLIPVSPAPSLCDLARTSSLVSLNPYFFICRTASTTCYRVNETVYKALWTWKLLKRGLLSFLLPLFYCFPFLLLSSVHGGEGLPDYCWEIGDWPRTMFRASGLKSWPNTVIKERNKKELSHLRPVTLNMGLCVRCRPHVCKELTASGEG